MVYDMTPYEERGENFNYVAFGAKNTQNNILASHYDKNSP
jgi:hypothetical protein